MKHLLIASLLAFAAPQADAGDFHLDLGVKRGKVRVGVHVGKRRSHRGTDVRVATRRGPRHRGHRQHRQHRQHRHRVWHRGHYKTVARQVWIPGRYERRYVPARYDYRWDCGRRVRYCSRDGGYQRVWIPGRYVTRYARVWVPGHYD